jgi:hypothetical protein
MKQKIRKEFFGKVNPYLSSDRRLADVIAAIQAMGTYKFYKLSFQIWGERISGLDDVVTARYWEQVFKEHPEFFRLDNERIKASLVWRRQYPKKYHVDWERKITEQDVGVAQERLSRNPLSQDDIKALIGIAIDLHAKASEEKRDRRWYIPVIAALLGTIIGASAAIYSASIKSSPLNEKVAMPAINKR